MPVAAAPGGFQGNAGTRRARPGPRMRSSSQGGPGVARLWGLTRSSQRTPWVRDFWWRWAIPVARGQSCPLLHDLATVGFPFQIGVFWPISPSWAQVVTTITRHRSSLVRSFYGPIGVPILFQPFINPLSNLRKKPGRIHQNESKYQQKLTFP